MKIKKAISHILPDSTKVYIKMLFNGINNKKMLQKKVSIKGFVPDKYPFGINLIGDIRAETGLGQSMRILADILEEGEIPFTIWQMDSPGELELNDDKWKEKISAKLKYSINLVHINPNIWAETYNKFSNEVFDYRYNIAFWLWELEEFPDKWVDCIETVDEIWTPSEFISKSIKKKTTKPVETVPYAICFDVENLYPRKYFELPEDKFLFLVMYDFKSISERKNPKAVIRAYKNAFDQGGEGTGLVIKINHLGKKRELEQLQEEMAGYKNIYYITDNLSRKEIESLIADVDVLVSLHRSEGFGLPLAEAMYLGTPVIATGWSANVEFMENDCSCLVNYTLTEIKRNIGPYEKGNQWAEADIACASQYMKKLYYDKEYWEEISGNGKKKIRQKLNIENAISVIKRKIKRLN